MQVFLDRQTWQAQENKDFINGHIVCCASCVEGSEQVAANILVVEDDPLNRDLICKILRNEGYRIVEACDGAQALDLLYAQRFDLVITDFVMPKLNGTRFVEHLHILQPRMPIIFITGYLSAISGKKILDEVAEVIPKPFEPGVLRSTVQRLLQSKSH